MFFKVGDCSRNSESAFIQFYIEFLFIQNHMKKKKNSKFSHRSDLLSTEFILYIKALNSSSKIESKQIIGIKLALESFKCPYSFLYFNVLTYLFQKIVLLVCFALSVYVCAFAYYIETVSFYYRLLFLSQFTMFTFYILIFAMEMLEILYNIYSVAHLSIFIWHKNMTRFLFNRFLFNSFTFCIFFLLFYPSILQALWKVIVSLCVWVYFWFNLCVSLIHLVYYSFWKDNVQYNTALQMFI